VCCLLDISNMKNIYFIFVLLLVFSCKSAESFLKKSELLRAEANYEEELYFLKKSFDLKPSVSTGRKITISYYSLKNYHQAEYWFKWIRSNSKISVNDHYILAEILISNGKYSEAKFLLEDLATLDEMQTSSFKWQNLIRITFDALNLVPNNPNKYIYSYKEVNSPYSDIALFSDNTSVYFLSNRLFYGQGNKPYLKNISLENIYYRIYEIDSSGNVFESGLINSTVKSDQNYHLGPFFLQDSLFVFTFSGYNPEIFKHKESVIKPQILVHEKNEFIKLISGDSEQFFVSDPYFDSKKQRIYFSSNLPGSIGGLDIFYVNYDSTSKKWSAPINAGDIINSLGDERAPFLFEDKLYFSSNGLGGLGGYDVFISDNGDNGFSKPLNLGIPFNSSADDLFYFYDSKSQFEYVTSDRDGGVGSDDIYRIETKFNSETKIGSYGQTDDKLISYTSLVESPDSSSLVKDLYYLRIPLVKLISDFAKIQEDNPIFSGDPIPNDSVKAFWENSFQLMALRNKNSIHLSYNRFNSDVFSLVASELRKNSSSKIEIKFYFEENSVMDIRNFIFYIQSEIIKNNLDPERFVVTRLEDLYLDDLSLLYYCSYANENSNFLGFNIINSNENLTEGRDYPQLGLLNLNYYSNFNNLLGIHHVNEFSGQFGTDVNYFMVVGSFRNQKDAEILRDRLSLKHGDYSFDILPPTTLSKHYRVTVLNSYCIKDILLLFDNIRKDLKIYDAWILSL